MHAGGAKQKKIQKRKEQNPLVKEYHDMTSRHVK